MVSAGDLVQLNVIYDRSDGRDSMENTFGFVALTGAGTFAGLANGFKTALVKNTSGGLLFPMSSVASSTRLVVRAVEPSTPAQVELDYAAVPGFQGDDPLPNQDSMLISWRTSNSGRSFRGRTYIPFGTEGGQADGVLGGGIQTALAAIVTQMLAVYGPSGSDANWGFCVISRFDRGAPRTPPIGTVVTSGLVRPLIATQRRRRT